VTKLDKVQYGEAAQSETVRKMVVAMARDIRVLVIKLADRLHNARTWRYVAPASAARTASETLEIYAPLAHRRGLNTLKRDPDDPCRQVRVLCTRSASPQGVRDPRDLRTAGAPPGHEHHQVGAGGPVLRPAVPQDLRRDRPHGGPACAGPRGVSRHSARRDPQGPQGVQDQGGRHRPTQALLLRLPEDDRPGEGLRADLRPGRGARPGG